MTEYVSKLKVPSIFVKELKDNFTTCLNGWCNYFMRLSLEWEMLICKVGLLSSDILSILMWWEKSKKELKPHPDICILQHLTVYIGIWQWKGLWETQQYLGKNISRTLSLGDTILLQAESWCWKLFPESYDVGEGLSIDDKEACL